MIRFNALKFNSVYFGQQNNQNQNNAQNQAKQDLINKNYNEIYAHEMAHKMAGGSLAGGIVIERNQDGIPVAGHVPIKMPSLDPNNPQKTIQDADTVIRSAMAPSDPSAQDYNVAGKARAIKSEAQDFINKHKNDKKLNYFA